VFEYDGFHISCAFRFFAPARCMVLASPAPQESATGGIFCRQVHRLGAFFKRTAKHVKRWLLIFFRVCAPDEAIRMKALFARRAPFFLIRCEKKAFLVSI
jgi:hypothetical protein